MTAEDSDTDFVCHCCICDPFLSEIVRVEGTCVSCSYCERVSNALSLGDLAERIHEVLQAHFEITPIHPMGHECFLAKDGFWERSGYFVGDTIADIAGVSAVIATDVRELLMDCYGLNYHALKDGEEEPYASDACYEERAADNGNLHETWVAFRNELRSRVRFFSTYAEEALAHVFGDLNTHTGFQNKPVIREVRLDDANNHLWRGRMAHSTKKLKEILKSPARKIGAPPRRRTSGGRMNASGIPVFYGALEQDTCVAELRAPVGSYVVMGKFELLRTVKLLDFDALMEIYVDASHFDPNYGIRFGRAAFLRSLVREICRPVMPQEEALEYLPSQVVAEYLANKLDPRLDGIIYPSSQTNGGHNVVLFNHACGVAPDDLPEGTDVKVLVSGRSHQNDDEGDDDKHFIQVFENVTQNRTTPPNNATRLAILTSTTVLDENGNEDEESPTWSEPTLRLDMKNVFVLDINSVCYECKRREVFRYRHVQDES